VPCTAWACALLVSCASLVHAQVGASEASNTLVLVRSAGDERVVPRIVAELGASAWSVVEVGPDAQLERASLSELASTRAASAALRVHAEAGTMELWIARAPGAADGSLETLSAADADERIPALRVTEALRARGLIAPRLRAAPQHEEAAPAPKPPAEEPKPEPEAKREPKPEAEATAPEPEPEEDAEELQLEPASPPRPLPPLPRMWVELAPAGAISAGGLGLALDVFASVRYQPAQRWSVALLALVPILGDRVHADEGSARVSTMLAGAGADLLLQSGRLELGLRAGAGAAFTFMRGDAREGFRSVNQTVVVAALFAGPSLHLHLGAGFRLALRAFGGLTLPRVAVRFADRDIAHWGRPFGVATLGVEYAF
jgi:hypothetical protein